MLAAGIQTPVPLEELESHFREEIDRQLKAGLDASTAFDAACRQLGSVRSVRDEFEKVPVSTGIRQWKTTDIFPIVFSVFFPLLIGGILLKRGGAIGMTDAERVSTIAAVVLSSLLAWTGRLGHGAFPFIARKSMRDAIGVAGSVLVALWWVVFLRVIVPHYDFTMSRFLVVFVWGFFTPAGVWIGIFWGMETAAKNRAAANH